MSGDLTGLCLCMVGWRGEAQLIVFLGSNKFFFLLVCTGSLTVPWTVSSFFLDITFSTWWLFKFIPYFVHLTFCLLVEIVFFACSHLKVTQFELEASKHHWFAVCPYTSYCWVSKLLSSIDHLAWLFLCLRTQKYKIYQ